MNTQQSKVVEFFVHTPHNIFICGGAGTGKSYLFRELISLCTREIYLVTAMTGVAAELIGGQTLHSALGLGHNNGSQDVSATIAHLRRHKKHTLWTTLDIIFIDEISMMSADLFSLVYKVAQKLRRNSEPFGGIRIVACGDFLQLGPVDSARLCFECDEWQRTFPHTCSFVLTEIVRQRDDAQWAAMLNRMSRGELTNDDKLLLATRRNPQGDWSTAIQLYCTNTHVNMLNEQKLQELVSNGNVPHTFKSTCTIESLRRAPVTLCVNARVMHIVNNSKLQIWNGSCGVVTRLTPHESVFVQFDNGKHVEIEYHSELIHTSDKHDVMCSFMPLRLAWASTIHKIQGSTLERGVVTLNRIFQSGQVYTALSRFTSLQGIKLQCFYPNDVRANAKCVAFYDALAQQPTQRKRANDSENEGITEAKKICV